MRRKFRTRFTAPVSTTTVRLAVACAVVFAVILIADSARAAIPGGGGAIAVTRCTPGSDCINATNYQIWLMEADGSGQRIPCSTPRACR